MYPYRIHTDTGSRLVNTIPSCTGVAVGAIIRYAIGGEANKELTLTMTSPQRSNHCDILGLDRNNTLTVGEVINLITLRDNFSCTVNGKVFRTKEGNFIQQTVSSVIQLMLVVAFDSISLFMCVSE